jgi:hypothetical protein
LQERQVVFEVQVAQKGMVWEHGPHKELLYIIMFAVFLQVVQIEVYVHREQLGL